MTDNPTLHTPKPPNAYSPIRAYMNSDVIVRTGAGNAYPKAHTLHKGQQITFWEPKTVSNDGTIWVYVEYTKEGLPTGSWMNSANLNFTFHPPTVEVKAVAKSPTAEVPAVKLAETKPFVEPPVKDTPAPAQPKQIDTITLWALMAKGLRDDAARLIARAEQIERDIGLEPIKV